MCIANNSHFLEYYCLSNITKEVGVFGFLIGLWWIMLLRAYGKITGDYGLQERLDVQTGLRMIINLCLTDGFDMFPSLLVTDGSCMIDRRMGIHGHPLEIQVSVNKQC